MPTKSTIATCILSLILSITYMESNCQQRVTEITNNDIRQTSYWLIDDNNQQYLATIDELDIVRLHQREGNSVTKKGEYHVANVYDYQGYEIETHNALMLFDPYDEVIILNCQTGQKQSIELEDSSYGFVRDWVGFSATEGALHNNYGHDYIINFTTKEVRSFKNHDIYYMKDDLLILSNTSTSSKYFIDRISRDTLWRLSPNTFINAVIDKRYVITNSHTIDLITKTAAENPYSQLEISIDHYDRYSLIDVNQEGTEVVLLDRISNTSYTGVPGARYDDNVGFYVRENLWVYQAKEGLAVVDLGCRIFVNFCGS